MPKNKIQPPTTHRKALDSRGSFRNDQQTHPAIRLIAARRDLFNRQGTVVAAWRQRPQSVGCVKRTTSGGPHPNPLPKGEGTVRPQPNPLRAPTEGWSGEGTIRPHPSPLPKGEGTKGCGPYYRLAYREDGRQRSVYLGREGPLVDEVRRLLADLQRPLQQRRAINRLRRQVSAALTVQKRRVDALLRPLGLRLKGLEVRGWRTSLVRSLWPTPPTIQPIRPLRRPQYRVSSLRSIRPPKLPRYNARRPTPAAIEERLWKVIAARDGHGSQ